MTGQVGEIDAVTLDFYNTLVYHQQGIGRGAMLMQYLLEQGLESDPWEHQVLYDVFEHHGKEYAPDLSDAAREQYLVRFTERLFVRLNVRLRHGTAMDHAAAVWEVLGPGSLGVFPDVIPLLHTIRAAGYPTALVSNWQCGLSHFCVELGLADAFDHIVVSAEVGSQKPDPEIFRIACRRLGVSPERTLHVGDTVVDDVQGARNASMPVVLLLRDGTAIDVDTPVIAGLDELPGLLGVDRAAGRDD
ncbi:MAG: HAD-IA family hydrolase [Gemmatimonadota bacterium]|nr:MAG: HAD-IA family hydrolase [Gemmatimonadota bacterium]